MLILSKPFTVRKTLIILRIPEIDAEATRTVSRHVVKKKKQTRDSGRVALVTPDLTFSTEYLTCILDVHDSNLGQSTGSTWRYPFSVGVGLYLEYNSFPVFSVHPV
jgi:hypothetical protein